MEDESDPAIMLVNSLIEKYPKVGAKLFVGGSDVGVNPKINNMNKAYEAASYEFILISDSGIRSKLLFFFFSSFLLNLIFFCSERRHIIRYDKSHDRKNSFSAPDAFYKRSQWICSYFRKGTLILRL